MRAVFLALSATMLLCGAGCNPLAGYVYKSEHFRFGTPIERDFSQSVGHVYKNVQFVLKERNFTIRRAEMANDETAQIWSSKDGLQIVFDIKGAGEGCVLHFEIDQAGEDQLCEALMREIQSMP